MFRLMLLGVLAAPLAFAGGPKHKKEAPLPAPVAVSISDADASAKANAHAGALAGARSSAEGGDAKSFAAGGDAEASSSSGGGFFGLPCPDDRVRQIKTKRFWGCWSRTSGRSILQMVLLW